MLEEELEVLLEELQYKGFDDHQISWIILGASKNLNYSIYCDLVYNSSQMKEIYTGLLNSINVYHYIDPEYTHIHMSLIRALIEANCYEENYIFPNTPISDLRTIKKYLKIKNQPKRYTPTYNDIKIQEQLNTRHNNQNTLTVYHQQNDSSIDETDFFDLDDIFDESVNENNENSINLSILNDENKNKLEFTNSIINEYLDYNMVSDYPKPLTQHINRFNIFKPEDEANIFRRYNNGQTELKERIINANLKLVNNMAYKYRTKFLTKEDLFSEGYLGLIEAIDRFDYNLGNKFSTYASLWIRQKITRSIGDTDSLIRVPIHTIELIKKLKKAENDLISISGKEPTNKELLNILEHDQNIQLPDNIDEEYIKDIRISSQLLNPNNYILFEEDENIQTSLLNEIINNQLPSPIEYTTVSIIIEILENCLLQLTDREEKILRLRLGLDDGYARTLEEVGHEFNVTRERIRQIEAKALRKLKHPSRIECIKPYYNECPRTEAFLFYKRLQQKNIYK